MIRLARFDWLGVRSPPHFGLVSLYSLLFCALALCLYFQTHWGGLHWHGERTGPATVLSVLPDALLLNPWVFAGCGVLFVVCALAWAAQRWLPWSSWLAALAYTAVVALYLENSSQATHVGHLTNTLLLLYALWYHFYHREIQEALRQGRFWATPLYPHWVHAASVFSVGLFYGLSGVTKLWTSGLAWPNGLSLQLWANLFGDPSSVFTRWILSNRNFAVGLQWITLLGESAGLIAIVSRRLRPWIGLALIGFHIGQISVFGWGFHANMVVLALFFLPVDQGVDRLTWLGARRGCPDSSANAKLSLEISPPATNSR
jgi:hypothetical protein